MEESKKFQSKVHKKGLNLIDQSIHTLPSSYNIDLNFKTIKCNYAELDNIIGTIPSTKKCNYAKLENPGLNFCFINSSIQLILAIKPLSDLLCYEYCKSYCKNDTFLCER